MMGNYETKLPHGNLFPNRNHMFKYMSHHLTFVELIYGLFYIVPPFAMAIL